MKVSLLSALLLALVAVAFATEDKDNELSHGHFKVMIDAEKGGNISVTRSAAKDTEDEDEDEDKDEDENKAATTTAPVEATTQAKEEEASRRRRSADDDTKKTSFSIVLASVVEVNGTGEALQAKGHGFTGLEDAEVNLTAKVADAKLPGTELTATKVGFQKSLGDAKLTVDVYLMTAAGNVTVDDEVMMLNEGMVKVIVNLDDKWMMCTADACDGEVGTQLNVSFKVMAKENGKFNAAVAGQPANMSFGNSGSIYWSNKVMTTGDTYEDLVDKKLSSADGMTEVKLSLPKAQFTYSLAASLNPPPQGTVGAAGGLAASALVLLAALLLHRL